MPVDQFEQLADADRLGGVPRHPERLESGLLLSACHRPKPTGNYPKPGTRRVPRVGDFGPARSGMGAGFPIT